MPFYSTQVTLKSPSTLQFFLVPGSIQSYNAFRHTNLLKYTYHSIPVKPMPNLELSVILLATIDGRFMPEPEQYVNPRNIISHFQEAFVRKQCYDKHCVQHVSIQFQCKGGSFKNSGKSGIFELDLANSTSENYLTLFQDQEEFRHSFLFGKEGNNAVKKKKS